MRRFLLSFYGVARARDCEYVPTWAAMAVFKGWGADAPGMTARDRLLSRGFPWVAAKWFCREPLLEKLDEVQWNSEVERARGRAEILWSRSKNRYAASLPLLDSWRERNIDGGER